MKKQPADHRRRRPRTRPNPVPTFAARFAESGNPFSAWPPGVREWSAQAGFHPKLHLQPGASVLPLIKRSLRFFIRFFRHVSRRSLWLKEVVRLRVAGRAVVAKRSCALHSLRLCVEKRWG